MSDLHWQFYPKSDEAPALVLAVVTAFKTASGIASVSSKASSNEVLDKVRPGLLKAGFAVESGKKSSEKIKIPVLFGENGSVEKSFDADAYHEEGGFVVEVEAGRGVTNNQFLKDLFQACMMQKVRYLGIAVRQTYNGNKDYEVVRRFFDTLYASQRLKLPLDGVLIVGY